MNPNNNSFSSDSPSIRTVTIESLIE
jgi:hypothetical protein